LQPRSTTARKGCSHPGSIIATSLPTKVSGHCLGDLEGLAISCCLSTQLGICKTMWPSLHVLVVYKVYTIMKTPGLSHCVCVGVCVCVCVCVRACMRACFTACLVTKLFDKLSPSSLASRLRHQALSSDQQLYWLYFSCDNTSCCYDCGLPSLRRSLVLPSFENHETSPRPGYSGDTQLPAKHQARTQNTDTGCHTALLLSQQRNEQSAALLSGALGSSEGSL
jgi:hypothetical protein